jgi:hypothetical protein
VKTFKILASSRSLIFEYHLFPDDVLYIMKLLFSVAIQHAASAITCVSKIGGHSIMDFGEISLVAAVSIFTLFFI